MTSEDLLYESEYVQQLMFFQRADDFCNLCNVLLFHV